MELRIREAAKRRGFTMKKLSDISGIDTVSLSRYNTGSVLIPIDKLKIIADTLNVEIAELFPTGENYAHFIVDGEWEGIRKK